jgi:phenylalanyl-tRNA synthetase beta chain
VPVVSVRLWDLERLVGRGIDLEELRRLADFLKLEFEEVRGDSITFEAPHDRLDLYSAEGLARAIALLLGLKKPTVYPVGWSSIHVDARGAPRYRPYVMVVVVRGVKLDDEAISQLFQLQEKLHLTHCGNRELVSIGLYDLDAIKPPVYYRAVATAEFRPLGYSTSMSAETILETTEKGRLYGHLVRRGKYPLLVDSAGTVLSLPPIINSEDTRITERSRNILIDVTGTEPRLMASVLATMALAVYERGGEVIEVARVVSREELGEMLFSTLLGRELIVGLRRVENLIGASPGLEKIPEYLERHGYRVLEVTESYVKVWVPPYRVDVIDEDDIVEDIAISMDYNAIGGYLEVPAARGSVHPLERVTRFARDILVGMGFTEVANFILTDPDYLTSLGYVRFTEIENPKMRTYSVLRPSLLPSVLATVSRNVKKYGLQDLKVFEVGDAVDPDNLTTSRRVSGSIYGSGVTLTDGLATVKTLLEILGIKPVFEPFDGLPIAIPGRAAKVVVKGITTGYVGEAHPRVLKLLELRAPLAFFEVLVSELLRVL